MALDFSVYEIGKGKAIFSLSEMGKGQLQSACSVHEGVGGVDRLPPKKEIEELGQVGTVLKRFLRFA